MLVAIRSSVFMIIYTVLTLSYGTLSLLLWFVPAIVRHKVLISWCWLVINLLRLVCGVRYQVVGKEYVQQITKPVVVLSKHQSAWETLYLQVLFWPASTILKKSLLKIPFFGWGLRGLRPIAIDRSNPREALKQVKVEGQERLRAGQNLLLFPEGTRVAPGYKRKYARSGPDIAIAAGAEIVPVAVNAGHCWPINSFLRYPGLITVIVGKPIACANRNSKEVIAEVEQWIEEQLEQLEGHPAALVEASPQV